MEVLRSVEISNYILATLIHVVALTMLVRASKHAVKGSQKYLYLYPWQNNLIAYRGLYLICVKNMESKSQFTNTLQYLG